MNSNQEMIYDDFENNPNVKALREFRRKPFEAYGVAGRKPVQRKEDIKCREKEIEEKDAIDNE